MWSLCGTIPYEVMAAVNGVPSVDRMPRYQTLTDPSKRDCGGIGYIALDIRCSERCLRLLRKRRDKRDAGAARR